MVIIPKVVLVAQIINFAYLSVS